jgi:hypothetical protein
MSTNIYYRINICEPCGRYDAVHVGKTAGGWSFLFRAYPHVLLNEEHPDWGYKYESPFGRPVASTTDWREVFSAVPGELWNQYDRITTMSPLEWVDMLGKPTSAQIKKEESMTRYHDPQQYRDAEGFRFTANEFC